MVTPLSEQKPRQDDNSDSSRHQEAERDVTAQTRLDGSELEQSGHHGEDDGQPQKDRVAEPAVLPYHPHTEPDEAQCGRQVEQHAAHARGFRHAALSPDLGYAAQLSSNRDWKVVA